MDTQINAAPKAKRGRKPNPNITKTIRLDPNTKAAMKQGRIKEGSELLEVTVSRCNLKGFQYGVTPIVSEKMITFHSVKKEKPPIANKINIQITEASNEPVAIEQAAPVSENVVA